MDTIFSLKPKKSIKAVSDNNTMMRLKMQNALIQQELNRVKAANAALALAAQQRDHQAKLALELVQKQQQQQRDHEAKLALEAHRQQQQHKPEAQVAPQIKKSKFGKLISDMNKRN
jgi:hypothetical protein